MRAVSRCVNLPLIDWGHTHVMHVRFYRHDPVARTMPLLLV